MITAVDTNVLLDVFGADVTFGSPSKAALKTAAAEGRLVASDAVWAEVSSFFASTREAGHALELVGIDFSPIEAETALTAGRAWRIYRNRGGRRDRVVADFLIGAHAARQAERLLTRDRGFYRSYFARLKVLDPIL